MLFNSQLFVLVFLPITLIGFFLLGERGWKRVAIGWLVVASAVFYGWFKLEYLFLLVIVIVVNFWIGTNLSKDHRVGRKRPVLLAAGIVANLGLLSYYKYTNFILDNLNLAFSTDFVFQKIILPLGISFFIFQLIAYLIDAYRGEAESYNFLDFCLFVMYFPQLVAGPIVHHKEIIPQYQSSSFTKLNLTDLAAGLAMFTIGLFKKIVIADELAKWVDSSFSAAQMGSSLGFLEAWSGALSFSFQIYFDFSAYSDMALGMALMISIRLPLNFNSPYQAENIVEFWRRWHMTLSRFLRDYLYIPLGGNRKGQGRRYVNLMVTMLLGGLWHGAAWTFVVWGALHGFYIIVNHGWHMLRRVLGLHTGIGGWAGLWSARLFTFLAVIVAWVFFRAESFDSAVMMINGMAGLNGVILTSWQAAWEMFVLFSLIAWVWLLPNTQQLLSRYRPTTESVPPPAVPAWLHSIFEFRICAAFGGVLAFVLLGLIIYQSWQSVALVDFIYFQF